jgi:hypothetical protein
VVNDEVQRVARLLESVVKLSRVPVREVERRAQYGAGTLSRLFSGRIELKLRHIWEVLDAVGMEPENFFQIVFRRDQEDSGTLAAQILAALRTHGYRPDQTSLVETITDEELERRIEAAVERILSERGARAQHGRGGISGR